jgi:hypothetical protein
MRIILKKSLWKPGENGENAKDLIGLFRNQAKHHGRYLSQIIYIFP